MSGVVNYRSIFFADLEQETGFLIMLKKSPSWKKISFLLSQLYHCKKKNCVIFSHFKASISTSRSILLLLKLVLRKNLLFVSFYLSCQEKQENYHRKFKVYRLNLQYFKLKSQKTISVA